MTRFIAFLRAVNVGGRIVKMDQLRKLFESMGFSSVETFIASGNVAFRSPARSATNLEKKIATELEGLLGYEVATFVRTDSELLQVSRYQPFEKSELSREGHTLYIGFLPSPPTAESRKRLMTFRNKTDDFHVNGREVYWLSRGRMSESEFSGAILEKTLRMPATLRNVNTVRKLAAKYCAEG